MAEVAEVLNVLRQKAEVYEAAGLHDLAQRQKDRIAVLEKDGFHKPPPPSAATLHPEPNRPAVAVKAAVKKAAKNPARKKT